MRHTRRKFLKIAALGTAMAAAGSWFWLTHSPHRVGRLFRQIMADSRRTILPAPIRPQPSLWSDSKITASWIGHATVLINFQGFRILTDPILGSRAGLSLGVTTVGTKRYVAPALTLAEVPPVDMILLSHAHMDHMDLYTLARLDATPATVTARATRDLIAGTRLRNIVELGWGEKTEVRTTRGSIEVEAFEVKHWGERWPSEKERGYNGYVLRRNGKTLLFGGDTAFTPLFANLKGGGPYELAIMPIGAYEPWIWNHCTPEEAVDLANMAGARYIMPIHHQTFRLSNEPMTEPIERFVAALDSEKERIALRQIGETFVLPA